MHKAHTPPNESAAASGATAGPATVPTTVVATASTSAPLQANKTTIKSTQPPPSMTDTTEALPEFELTEDALAGKEQSKRQKSPPGDDVSVIVLSSDNASGDESAEETVDTTKPRQIKTEPISTEIEDAAANDSTTEGAAPPQAPAPDGDDAQRHHIEHQSEDSDADDEESVHGHDSEPDVTDVDEVEHQCHSSEQSVLKEPSPSNAVDNQDDEAHTNACKRTAHTTDVADNNASDDDADDVSSNESGEESDTSPADIRTSRRHQSVRVSTNTNT